MSTNQPIYKLLNWIDENKLNWHYLSLNSNAIKLLEQNQDKIIWADLSINPSIFKLDYKQMAKNFEPLAEEIIAKALHPKRINRLMLEYNFDFEDWFD